MATEKTEKDTSKQIGKDNAVPELDLAFGYYWEENAGKDPKWHVFHGQPAIFRRALADALLNKRLKRLYFAVNGVWVEMPLGSDPSLRERIRIPWDCAHCRMRGEFYEA